MSLDELLGSLLSVVAESYRYANMQSESNDFGLTSPSPDVQIVPWCRSFLVKKRNQ